VRTEFGDGPARLATAAAGIRAAIDKLDTADVLVEPEFVSEAPEGTLTPSHVRRERSVELVADRKGRGASDPREACVRVRATSTSPRSMARSETA
jgi:hypothetical protein